MHHITFRHGFRSFFLASVERSRAIGNPPAPVSTTLSASSRSVQRLRPSGGVEQASRVICASRRPSTFLGTGTPAIGGIVPPPDLPEPLVCASSEGNVPSPPEPRPSDDPAMPDPTDPDHTSTTPVLGSPSILPSPAADHGVVYKFVCKNEKRTVTTDEWLESDVSSGMWRCLDAIPHPGANHS